MAAPSLVPAWIVKMIEYRGKLLAQYERTRDAKAAKVLNAEIAEVDRLLLEAALTMEVR